MRKLLLTAALLCAAAAQASLVIDRSGTVTTAGTSQQVMATKASRTYLMCQNPIGAAGALFVNFDGAASTTGGSLELAPGGAVTMQGSSFMVTGPVTVTSATAGARYICKEA